VSEEKSLLYVDVLAPPLKAFEVTTALRNKGKESIFFVSFHTDVALTA
jgi:hypothetical protein